MAPEDVKARVDLMARAPVLLSSGIEQLLADQELELEPWREAARAFETLLPVLRAPAEPQLPEALLAFGRLAQAMAAPDLAAASSLAAQIPEVPDFDLARRLGESFLARRRAEAEGSIRPAAFAHLAESIYALLSFARDRDQAAQLFRRAVQAYQAAVEGFTRQGDSDAAVHSSTMYLALANEVASHFEVDEFLADALAWGETLLAADPPPSGKTGLSLCVVANNLINTCAWLARHRSNPETFIAKQVAVALRGRALCLALQPEPEQAALHSQLHENILRGLISSQASLGLLHLSEFARYADSAWEAYQELQELVAGQGDPVSQLRCGELGRQLYQRFHAAKPDWIPPAADLPQDLPEPDVETMFDRLKSGREEVRATADRILGLPDREQRCRELEETVGAAYEEMTTALATVLAEIGLNHHACRYVAALGGIASGRLGELALNAIVPWVLHSKDLEKGPAGHRRQVRHRQFLPALGHFQAEAVVLSALEKLALLSARVQGFPELRERFQALLRERTTRLLSSLLPPMVHIHSTARREHSATSDLAVLLRSLPAEGRSAAWEEYTQARKQG